MKGQRLSTFSSTMKNRWDLIADLMKIFSRCITWSTYILTETASWLSFFPAFFNYSRLFKKADMSSVTPIFPRSSDIKKPRSDIMRSFFPESA